MGKSIPATRLHIPAPTARPGDEPDFSNLDIPPAGVLDRPDVATEAHEIEDLAYTLIRVLDDDHQAVGAWNPQLSPQVLRDGLRHMVMVRLYDEQMFKLQRQGKISFYMKCTGEEAVAVGAAAALRYGDMLFPTYRQQGLLVARGRPLVDMMCHCLSNSKDNAKGRQMPVLYTWEAGNFFTISGNLGTQFSQAVGWGMAAAYKNTDDIAVTWVGDGTTAEADFHYGLNFASVYRSPTVMNIVNNQWAISSFQGIAAGEKCTFAERAHGYGIPGLRVDGNDFLAVYAATLWAAERARQQVGPTVIELFTYRVEGHSTSDDPTKYRPKSEAQRWPLGDPIERLKQHLIALDEWSEEQHTALEEECKQQITAAMVEAETYGTLTEEPRLSPSTIFEDVFKEPLPHLVRQRQQMGY